MYSLIASSWSPCSAHLAAHAIEARWRASSVRRRGSCLRRSSTARGGARSRRSSVARSPGSCARRAPCGRDRARRRPGPGSRSCGARLRSRIGVRLGREARRARARAARALAGRAASMPAPAAARRRVGRAVERRAAGAAATLGRPGVARCRLRAKAAPKAFRLGLTPTPPRSMVASNCARLNGSTPVPASAPNSTALITLPDASAACAMSKRTKRLAARCGVRRAARRRRRGRRPSPSSRRSRRRGASMRSASCGRA